MEFINDRANLDQHLLIDQKIIQKFITLANIKKNETIFTSIDEQSVKSYDTVNLRNLPKQTIRKDGENHEDRKSE